MKDGQSKAMTGIYSYDVVQFCQFLLYEEKKSIRRKILEVLRFIYA